MIITCQFQLLKQDKHLSIFHKCFIEELNDVASSETEKPNATLENLIESSGSTDTATVDYLDSLSEVFDGEIKR